MERQRGFARFTVMNRSEDHFELPASETRRRRVVLNSPAEFALFALGILVLAGAAFWLIAGASL